MSRLLGHVVESSALVRLPKTCSQHTDYITLTLSFKRGAKRKLTIGEAALSTCRRPGKEAEEEVTYRGRGDMAIHPCRQTAMALVAVEQATLA
jgi:hypothetical protein